MIVGAGWPSFSTPPISPYWFVLLPRCCTPRAWARMCGRMR